MQLSHLLRPVPEEFPEINNHFKNGDFLVKGKPGTFNAVSPNMKSEQTIQSSKKSQSGKIGQTQQNSYVTEWELVYHKILNISNLFHCITNSRLSFHETDLLADQFQLYQTKAQKSNNFFSRKKKSLSCNKASSFHERAMCKRK